MRGRVFASFSGLYPLDASSNTQSCNQKLSPGTASLPGAGAAPLLPGENGCSVFLYKLDQSCATKTQAFGSSYKQPTFLFAGSSLGAGLVRSQVGGLPLWLPVSSGSPHFLSGFPPSPLLSPS